MRVGELGWTVTAACPDCGRDLRLVERRDGGTFVGCTGYPVCSFTAARDVVIEELVRESLEMKDLLERVIRASLATVAQRVVDLSLEGDATPYASIEPVDDPS